jgi:hypothetical protein
MVLVYPELLLEAARMLKHVIGERDRQAYQLSRFLEAAAKGEVTVWPPKDYKPVC